ncbi:phosphopantetheine-binding protein [Streptomyces sp. NPDC002851]
MQTAPAGERAAAIIAEVLGLPEAPLHENLYDVGGSSLQGIRICARIQKELGVKASPEDLFESETLGDFCASVANAPAQSLA